MFLRPGGYSLVTDGAGGREEHDTATCKHCQRIIFVAAKTDPNEFWCASCAAPICGRCKAQEANRPRGACSHFERRLLLAEAQAAFRRDLGAS